MKRRERAVLAAGRGDAISLADVERALRGHTDVVDAAIFRLTDTLSCEVAAAIVLRPGAGTTDEQLRRFAHAALGTHKGLRQVLVVDRIPTDASGERWSRDLADIFADRLRPPYVPPCTDIERLLAGWWTEVLGVDDIGRTDDFFQLGGDSIKAMMICSRARNARIHLEAPDFAEQPTLARLAAAATPALPSALPDAHDDGSASCALLPAQHYYFTDVFDDGVPLPFIVLESRTPYAAAALRAAAGHLVAHHDALRTRLRQTANGPVQVVAPTENAIEIDTIDLSHVDSADRPSAFEALLPPAEAWSMTRGPAIRFVLVRLGDRERFVILAHHAVADRVALNILAEDFQAAYDRIAAGEPVAAFDKTTSVSAWVRHRRAQAASGAFARELDRLEQIRRVPPIAAETSCEGATYGRRLVLDSALVRRVWTSAARWRVEPSAVFASAFAYAWARRLRRRAVVLSYMLSGRRDVPCGFDLSRTVGCLVVMAPVLLYVDADSTLEGLSRLLHDQLVEGERYAWLSDRPMLEHLPSGAVNVHYKVVKQADPTPAGVRPIAAPLFTAGGQIDRLQAIPPAAGTDAQSASDAALAQRLRLHVRVGTGRATLAFIADGLSVQTIDHLLNATREALDLGLTSA